MTLAPDLSHPFWDNIGINLDGKVAVVQTKTGESYSANDVEDWMAEDHPNLYEQVYADVQNWVACPEIIEEHPELATIAERLAEGPDSFVSDRYFAFGSELYGKAVPSGIDETGRIVADIGSTAELEGTANEGLELLSDNIGIDIPDGIGDILPYAGAIIAGARLVYSVIKTEKEFKAADRTTRNKIQVVQSLTVMSRLGVITVMATAGGMAGTAAGSVLPGPGNLIGGIVGSIGGAGIGRNRYVPEQASPTPHAEPCLGHYRADQRRLVLLQEQASHRHGGLELPNDCQFPGSRSRIIGLQIARYP